ncbi:MAG: Holliday junction resolvase RuvX [Propionibacteriaceae bacterium]|jgi:putative Holliday junction resolvase|nr:Holliday junction resolvase RuvX [Propionibacteriaceae bacterium]
METLPSGVMLALDLGAARIGVAACDSARILAYPVATVAADDQWIDRVLALADEHQAAVIVVGYPLALDGRVGVAATAIGDKAGSLSARTSTPIWLVDERLTTAEAHRRLRETGHSAKTDRMMIDAQAAVGILDTMLQALRQGRIIGRRLDNKEAHD